ncbi:MAG: AMP-binding protein, partial [Comamonas sp.]
MTETTALIPLHDALRRNAQTMGERSAYIWYGQHITWRALDATSDALAAHLQSIGVKPGEPVALFMNNCPQYVVAHYAIQKIGAIVCPCGPLNKSHELDYQLNDLQAKVIIAADNLLPIVEQVKATTSLQHVLAVRYTDWLPAQPEIPLPPELQTPAQPLPAGVASVWDIMHSSQVPAPVHVALGDVALMTYTSGTTGLPKGAMLSYRSAAYKTQAASMANGVLQQDILLAVAPLYHI